MVPRVGDHGVGSNDLSGTIVKPAAKYGIGIAAFVVVLGGVGLFVFLRDDAPAEVSLEAATEGVDATTSTTGDDPEETPPADDGISGTWSVDAATGEVDFDEATGSFVGFRVQEELSSIGAATAVGRTRDVAGTMEIDGTTLVSADVEAQMATITTDDSRRDDKVREALETDTFPTATFSLTEPVDLGTDSASGAEVAVDAVGELTVHGVTRPVTIPLQARLVDGTVVVVGTADVALSDFDVEAPSAPIVVSVSDDAAFELQLLFTRS